MITVLIGGNPGFLLSSIELAEKFPNDTFILIYKEELPGGSWKFDTNKNNIYYANHFFCSNNQLKLENFKYLNKKYFDLELNEIDKQYIYVPNTKYIEYKFYTFDITVPCWVNKLYENIIKKKNILLLSNSKITYLRILKDKITIEYINKNNIIKVLFCNKIYFTRNTLFENIFVNNNIFYPKLHSAFYIHEFLEINIKPYLHLIINAKENAKLGLVQHLDKINDKNIIVCRYSEDLKLDDKELDEELKELLNSSDLKVLERQKLVKHTRLGTTNYRDLLKLIEDNNIDSSNIKIILDDNSLIDDCIID